VLRGRGFSMRAILIERIVLSNKVQKMAGFSGAEASCVQCPASSKKGADRSRRLWGCVVSYTADVSSH
jgi:hypothetical protein